MITALYIVAAAYVAFGVGCIGYSRIISREVANGNLSPEEGLTRYRIAGGNGTPTTIPATIGWMLIAFGIAMGSINTMNLVAS